MRWFISMFELQVNVLLVLGLTLMAGPGVSGMNILPVEAEHPFGIRSDTDASLDPSYNSRELSQSPGAWSSVDSSILQADAQLVQTMMPQTTMLTKQHDVVVPSEQLLRGQSSETYMPS